jgi:hypothetical protein
LREIEGGIINTFAGTGTAGFSGDGGNPLLAQINATGGVALDKKGNIAFVDQTRIRIVKKGGLSAENETVVPSNVSIYPNPSEGRCTLRIGGNTTTPVYVTITNVLGSLVARFSASTNTPIAINLDRHPGLYFVTATSSSGTTTRPLLID